MGDLFDRLREHGRGGARAIWSRRAATRGSYAMVGFGGAGPAHAAAMARILGVADVIIPPASGAASALGFLAAPVSFEFARSAPVVIDEALDFVAINRLLAEIEVDGRRLLAEAGIADGVTVSRQADMRLLGQMHEIAVDLPPGVLGPGDLDEIRRRFAASLYAALHASLHRRRDRGAELAGPGIGSGTGPVTAAASRRRAIAPRH